MLLSLTSHRICQDMIIAFRSNQGRCEQLPLHSSAGGMICGAPVLFECTPTHCLHSLSENKVTCHIYGQLPITITDRETKHTAE